MFFSECNCDECTAERENCNCESGADELDIFDMEQKQIVKSKKIQVLDMPNFYPLRLELNVSPVFSSKEAAQIHQALINDPALYEAGLDFPRIKIGNTSATITVVMGVKNPEAFTEEKKNADIKRISTYLVETLKLPKISLKEMDCLQN